MISPSSPDAIRDLLRQIFHDTIREISIPRVLKEKVEYSRGVLRVEQDLYDLSAYSRVLVIAMGKAGHTMLDSLIAQTGPALEGIVVCSDEPAIHHHGFRYFRGSHPLPNEASMRAARAILKTISGLDANALVIYLISGGASAMVEVPSHDEISLEDLIATYRVLVNSGAAIAEMNAIRKHLSAIKGGRLAQAASRARQVSIMVSDVPEKSLDALASGPTMPDSSTVEDCYRIAEECGILSQLPDSVRAIFEKKLLEETPKTDDPAFVHSRWWPILGSSAAAQTAARLLSQHGFAVEIDNTPDDWLYERAADYLLKRARELRKGVQRVALISAGEVSVRIEETGGTGGRNQQFALFCAQQIAGENLAVLSAGTDGIDGNSPAAGAAVDGTTVDRAAAMGHDVRDALTRFDAYPLLAALDDAIETGPTGNNVRDLRVILAY